MSVGTGITELIASSGFGARFGEMIEVSGDGDAALWTLRPHTELVGNAMLPALHGGAVIAFLEIVAGAALASRLQRNAIPPLISINVQFLATVRVETLTARCVIRRVGRRVAATQIEAWQADPETPVCAAQCEFSCLAS